MRKAAIRPLRVITTALLLATAMFALMLGLWILANRAFWHFHTQPETSAAIHLTYWLYRATAWAITIGFLIAGGWAMAYMNRPFPWWASILPAVILYLSTAIMHYVIPHPANHNLDFFSGFQGLLLLPPISVVGWWIEHKRNCANNPMHLTASRGMDAAGE